MRMDPINLYDYEARARQALPFNNWEFIEAGAMDELTLARNRSAFEALTLRPRFMRDVTERKISTTVLGTDISFPVMISPAEGHTHAHPEGELRHRARRRDVQHPDDVQHHFPATAWKRLPKRPPDRSGSSFLTVATTSRNTWSSALKQPDSGP